MKQKNRTRNSVLAALFAALIAVLSQIQLWVGLIPYNLAFLGIFLAGMLLTPLWATLSVLLYFLLGVIGVPVFVGFQAGPAVLFGKTGGYLIGYFFLAALTSYAEHRFHSPLATGAGMLLGIVVCYAFGTVWFMVLTGAGLLPALSGCVFPFVIPDILKGVAAYAIGKLLSRRLAGAGAAL